MISELLRTPPAHQAPQRSRSVRSGDLLGLGVLVTVLIHFAAPGLLTSPALLAWSTVFVAICLRALPFLVLGVLLSAAISTLVPASFLTRALPRRPALAVPVAGAAGMVLPGCECASVPVAGSLVGRGVPQAAALAFLLPPRRSTRWCWWPPRSPSPGSRKWSLLGSPPRCWWRC